MSSCRRAAAADSMERLVRDGLERASGGLPEGRRSSRGAHGATRSTRPRCSVSPRTSFRPRWMRAAEMCDFWRFNAAYMQQIYGEQPGLRARHLGLRGVPAARRASWFAVSPFNFTSIGGNLCLGPGADGQHGAVEAGIHGGPVQLLHAAGVARGWPARRRDQLRSGPRRAGRQPGLRAAPRWLGCTSPAPRRPSSSCGDRWRSASRTTAATRGSSARQAARTSSSPIRRPTRRRWRRR